MAIRYHPDKNHGDSSSGDRFIEVSNAFAVLRDAEKRQLYDEYGSLGLQLANQFGAEWVRKYLKRGSGAKTKFLIILFGILSCGYCFCCCCMFCCGRCKPGVSQDDVDYQDNVLRRELNEERDRYLFKERERQQQMMAARDADEVETRPQKAKKSAANSNTNANASTSTSTSAPKAQRNEAFSISDEAAAQVVPGAPIDPKSPFAVAYAQRVAQQRHQPTGAASASSANVPARRSSTGANTSTGGTPRSASSSSLKSIAHASH